MFFVHRTEKREGIAHSSYTQSRGFDRILRGCRVMLTIWKLAQCVLSTGGTKRKVRYKKTQRPALRSYAIIIPPLQYTVKIVIETHHKS